MTRARLRKNGLSLGCFPRRMTRERCHRAGVSGTVVSRSVRVGRTGVVRRRIPLLGDLVRRVTRVLRIPHCGACERRQAFLNDLDQGFRDLFSGEDSTKNYSDSEYSESVK